MKSKLYKSLEIICHILGFPIFLLAVVLIDLKVFKNGAGYGIFPYVSIILVVLGAIIYYSAYFILRLKIKKQKKKNEEKMLAYKSQGIKTKIAHPARKAGVVLAIIVIVCTCGLWAFVDLVLPDPLAGATSNTLYWEDLSDNWAERADVNKELLDTFITRSYYAGTLSSKTLDEYLDEGVTNKEVQVLLEKEFASIDKNGYGTLIGPSIDFATNDRMTIPALIHLLLDEREPVTDENGNRLDQAIPITTFKAVYVDDFMSDEIAVGGLYTYLRSSNKYSLIAQKTDQTGNVGSGDTYALEEIATATQIKTYEQRPGYLKVQYLNAIGGQINYNYIVDTNGGNLHFDYTEVEKDSVIKEVEIIQKSKSELEITVMDYDGSVYVYYIQGKGILNQSGDNYSFDNSASFTYSLSVNGAVTVTSASATINSLDDVIKGAISDADFLSHISEDHTVWNEGSYLSDMFGDPDLVLEKTTTEIYATWNVLDMLGEPMGFSLPLDGILNLKLDNVPILGTIDVGKIISENPHMINDIFATVSALASNDLLVGSNLTVTFDSTTGDITLIPANEERGTLDYMKQAWLNSNGLIYLLVSFFSLRKITLIYAPILAILSYAIGALLELIDKEKDKENNLDPSVEVSPVASDVKDTDC